MNQVSEMPRPDETVAPQMPEGRKAPAGGPTRFPVLFGVIAGLGLVTLATLLVEFVAR